MDQISNGITESQKKFQDTMNLKTEKENDEIDLFYKSLSLSVKRLPNHLINEAKMQHLQIIANLEQRVLHENNSNHTFSNNSNHFSSLNVHLEDSGFEIISD